VILHPSPKQDVPVDDWSRHARGLEVTLQSKSTGLYPYQVTIKQ